MLYEVITEEEAAAAKPAPRKEEVDTRPKKRAGLSYKEQRELEAVEQEIAEREEQRNNFV